MSKQRWGRSETGKVLRHVILGVRLRWARSSCKILSLRLGVDSSSSGLCGRKVWLMPMCHVKFSGQDSHQIPGASVTGRHGLHLYVVLGAVGRTLTRLCRILSVILNFLDPGRLMSSSNAKLVMVKLIVKCTRTGAAAAERVEERLTLTQLFFSELELGASSVQSFTEESLLLGNTCFLGKQTPHQLQINYKGCVCVWLASP